MDTFERAKSFIYLNARPVDLARWAYHFERGAKENVLRALSHYQNADGGFGHALEPDGWNPDSSPIHTWTATEILREIGFTDAEHPIIQGILRYLDSGKDFDGRYWHGVIKTNDDHPCSAWWRMSEDGAHHDDDNPAASLIGFIIRFATRGTELYDKGVQLARAAYDTYCALGAVRDMHTLSNYTQLLYYIEAAGASDIIDLASFRARLKENVDALIVRDTEKWKTDYTCFPSRFISSKDSPFYEGNRDIVRAQYAFLRASQLPDGSWNIPWTWDRYPEEWAIAKNWWRSIVIIENALFLRAFGADD